MKLSRFPWMTGRAAAAALLAVLVAAAVAVLFPGGRGAPSATKYRPTASVPRLVPEPFTVPELGRLTSFDATDDRLYLLDGMNHRVVRLDRSPDGAGWRPALSFGRRGAGPAEFEFPTGIAVGADGVVTVADGSRLHRFAGDGTHLSTRVFALGCAHYGPDVISFGNALLVTASCWQGDTLVMVLALVPPAGEARRLSTEPRASLDGHVGSFLVAGGAVADDGRFLFGTGVRPCLVHGDTAADRLQQVCGVARDLYGDRPHPRTEAILRQQRRQRPRAARALRWPDAFPVYRQMMIAPGGDVLFRQFMEDSAVLRHVGSDADLLVAGLEGLVGCRRVGCLWEFPHADGAGIFLLPASGATHWNRTPQPVEVSRW